MKAANKTTIVVIGCVCSMMMLAILEAVDGVELARQVFFDVVLFLAFWLAVGLVISLTGKILSWMSGAKAGEVRGEIAPSVALLLVALAIVVLYAYFVIVPVVAVPEVEQTGIGSFWLVCSVITSMISLPVAAGLAEML